MPSPSLPPGGKERRQQPPKPTALWWVLGALTLLAIGQAYFLAPPGRQISYSEFKTLVRSADRWPKSPSATSIIHGTLKKAENGATDVHHHAHRRSQAGRRARCGQREVFGRGRQPVAARSARLGGADPAADCRLVVLLPAHRRRGRRRDVVRAQQGQDLRRRRRQDHVPGCGRRRRSGAGAARDRRVPEEPAQVHQPRRQDSQGRAAGRARRAPARRCSRARWPAKPRCRSSA